jgi:SOS-response transcriptional repressor LexA
MDKTDLHKRLVKMREKLGISSRKIAMEIGADPSYYAKAEKGGSISTTYLDALIEKYNIDRSWLYFGDKIDYGENDPRETVNESGSEYGLKEIPYYEHINASAGLNLAMLNNNERSIPIKIPNVDAQAFINVFGDSMYPKYCSGEIIGIKHIEKEFVMFGPAYVVQLKNGEAYLKYILPGKDKDHWILSSENSKYPQREFHLSKIDKVFIIKAVITKTTL